ncbi:helix-turn-helix domain-containing protein [Micromonospora mangrovi]|uniref:Helix-turn-helix transcriptional regulator n=2 Tax=Micromonospora TaxID=1873 RepID=A0AAU8HEA7_9ACTN
MRTRRARPTTAVPINGAALRRIRIDRGIEVAELARRIQVSRPYISKLELGHSKRVSPTVHKALLQVLQLTDRDALRADTAAA